MDTMYNMSYDDTCAMVAKSDHCELLEVEIGEGFMASEMLFINYILEQRNSAGS